MLGQWTIYNGLFGVWNGRSSETSSQEKKIGVLQPIQSITGWALVASLLLNVLCATTLDVWFLLGGLLKAAWWAAIFQLVVRSVPSTLCLFALMRSQTLDTPVSIAVKASTVGTALTCVQNVQRPLLALPAALVAAYHLCLMFPVTRKSSLGGGRPWTLSLSMLFLMGFLSFIQLNNFSRAGRNLPSSPLFSASPKHAIEALIDAGKARYAATLRSQSQTLGDAVNEYRRRYGRPPPRGFDSWFHIAKSQGLIIIDDYDTVMGSLETFWRFSPSTLRRNIKAAATHLDLANDLILRDGKLSTTREPEFFLLAEMVRETADYLGILPNISMPVLFNRLDDIDLARIVLPHDAVGSPKKIEPASNPQDFEWLDLYAQFTWDTLLISCPPDSPARQDQKQSGHTKGLPFLADVPGSKNVCVHPELRHQHGAWSPSRRHYISHKPVPIFSSSKTSLNGDILFPSPYYANDVRRAGANESKAWDEKSNDLYWAGRTTGMRVFQASKWPWRSIASHRHRFVELVNDLGVPRNVTLLEKDLNGRWQPRDVPMASQSHLYDVSFSGVSQCDDEHQCTEMKTHFNITSGHSSEEHKNHRFLFDLDGNAFSGRFYRLLEANATVLKQTIFQEWHDDSLIPWYHYVPVSMGMEELPEIMHYLAETDRGQQRAREIAHQAAEWAKLALRREDVGAVFVRVLLEYARLINDDRDNINCC